MGPLVCKKWFPLILLRTSYHTALIYNMLIGLVEDMTNIDFGFTRLKVKVTMVTCKKYTWFPLIILRTVYPRAFTFHMLIVLMET